MRGRSVAVVGALVVALLPIAPPPAGAEISSEVVRTWGVTGLADPITTTIPSHIWAIEQVGNTIYVGGRFTRVIERREDVRYDQPFLAAFDATTGVWIDWWRPNLDGSVFALKASPDGSRLFVGGEFTSVNGHPMTAGLVAIDPASGLVDPSWRASLDLFWAPAPAVVRDLEIHDGWLYAGGNFTHVTSPPTLQRRNVFKAMRVSVADGAVDRAWKPIVTGGSVWSLAPSPDGSRVYLTGIFRAVNGAPGSEYFWTVDTVHGSTVPGLEPYPFNDIQREQFGVIASGDKVFVGGAQHHLTVLNAADLSLDQSYFTGRGPDDLVGGGDFQEIVVVDDRIYASCHCFKSIWQGNQFLGDISGLVALDGATGDYITSWPGIPPGRTGPWAIHGAGDGCLWLGGDMHLRPRGDLYVNSLVKLCDEEGPGPPVGPPLQPPPPDAAPPGAPGAPTGVVADDTEMALSWGAATDANGIAHYNVYRDGELIGATGARTFRYRQDPGGPFTWTVTAVDPSGNESATSPPLRRRMPAVPGGFLTIVDTTFDDDADGFPYRDDAFRGTSQPGYASGQHLPWAGFAKGGLELRLGNVDDEDVQGMSGGFDFTFTLDAPTAVGVSFRYNVLQSEFYEGDEYSEALLAIDGKLIGEDGNDYVARVNGGGASRWQRFRGDLGVLDAGSHTLTLGGFNNKKSFANEVTQILFDDLVLGATAPGVAIVAPSGERVPAGTAVPIRVGARDLQDQLGTLDVDVRPEGSGWMQTTWNAATLRYELTWDTSGLPAGPARLDARATDQDGNTTIGEPSSIVIEGPPRTYPDQVVGDGAVAFWRLGEVSGSTAVDTAGNNDGTYKGDPRLGVAGLIEGTNPAVRFDGTGDRVKVPDSTDLNIGKRITRYSTELWFNATNTRRRQVLYEQGDATRGLAVYLRNGRLYGGAWNAKGKQAFDPVFVSAPVAGGVTYHAVMVFDEPAGRLRLYLDGTLADSATGIGKLPRHRANIGIGAMIQHTRFDNGASTGKRGHAFNGTLDEIAIYRTALTPTTIRAHHQAGS